MRTSAAQHVVVNGAVHICRIAHDFSVQRRWFSILPRATTPYNAKTYRVHKLLHERHVSAGRLRMVHHEPGCVDELRRGIDSVVEKLRALQRSQGQQHQRVSRQCSVRQPCQLRVELEPRREGLQNLTVQRRRCIAPPRARQDVAKSCDSHVGHSE